MTANGESGERPTTAVQDVQERLNLIFCQVQMALHHEAQLNLFPAPSIRLVGGGSQGETDLVMPHNTPAVIALAALRYQCTAGARDEPDAVPSLLGYVKSLSTFVAAGADVHTSLPARLGHRDAHDNAARPHRYSTLIGEYAIAALVAAHMVYDNASWRSALRAGMVLRTVVRVATPQRDLFNKCARLAGLEGGLDYIVALGQCLVSLATLHAALDHPQQSLAALTSALNAASIPNAIGGMFAGSNVLGAFATRHASAIALVRELLLFREACTVDRPQRALRHLQLACDHMNRAKWPLPELKDWPKEFEAEYYDRHHVFLVVTDSSNPSAQSAPPVIDTQPCPSIRELEAAQTDLQHEWDRLHSVDVTPVINHWRGVAAAATAPAVYMDAVTLAFQLGARPNDEQTEARLAALGIDTHVLRQSLTQPPAPPTPPSIIEKLRSYLPSIGRVAAAAAAEQPPLKKPSQNLTVPAILALISASNKPAAAAIGPTVLNYYDGSPSTWLATGDADTITRMVRIYNADSWRAHFGLSAELLETHGVDARLLANLGWDDA